MGPGFSWVCLLFVDASVVIVAGVLVFFVVCCVHCWLWLALLCVGPRGWGSACGGAGGVGGVCDKL